MSDVKTEEQIRFYDLAQAIKAEGKKQNRNITDRMLAKITKLTPQQVSQILAGKRGTREHNVDKLQEYYDQLRGMIAERSDESLEKWRLRALEAEEKITRLREVLASIGLEANSDPEHNPRNAAKDPPAKTPLVKDDEMEAPSSGPEHNERTVQRRVPVPKAIDDLTDRLKASKGIPPQT